MEAIPTYNEKGKKLVFRLEVFEDNTIRLTVDKQKEPIEKKVDARALALYLFNVSMMGAILPSE